MILRLAGQLKVPMRDQNVLLVAGGYAPVFPETPLDAPALQAARSAVDRVLTGHEPFPALAIDRHWTLVASNRTVPLLFAGVDPSLLQPPINVLRLTLHPAGLASRIANLGEWRAHLLERVGRQIELTADPVLADLAKELRGYPEPRRVKGGSAVARSEDARVGVPLQLIVEGGVLSFFSTTTVFGTPIDITLSELALEAFYPSDGATAAAVRQIAES